MRSAPKRPCFRFSLRTLFAAVTVFGVWFSYQLNWIRQREALFDKNRAFEVEGLGESILTNEHHPPHALRPINWHTRVVLWLFRQPQLPVMHLYFLGESYAQKERRGAPDANEVIDITPAQAAEVAFAETLFPESEVDWRIMTYWHDFGPDDESN
jgi:hypothetical protein